MIESTDTMSTLNQHQLFHELRNLEGTFEKHSKVKGFSIWSLSGNSETFFTQERL